MDCIVHGVTKSQTWQSDFHSHSLCFNLSSSVVLSFCSPVLQNPQSSPLCISFLPWDHREDHTTMWIGVSTNLPFQSQVDFCPTCYSPNPSVPPVHQWSPFPSVSWLRSRLRVKSKIVLIYLGLRFCKMGKQNDLGSSVSVMKESWGINWKGEEGMSRSELTVVKKIKGPGMRCNCCDWCWGPGCVPVREGL